MNQRKLVKTTQYKPITYKYNFIYHSTTTNFLNFKDHTEKFINAQNQLKVSSKILPILN